MVFARSTLANLRCRSKLFSLAGWGQGANNYELGLGEGQPKSATKPTDVAPLNGIHILEYASLFLPPVAFNID